jgi:16S rRNA G966 N2-methylase RsmD
MRIIAGELKGRKLHTPQWQGFGPPRTSCARPSSTCVRARAGRAVLDLYSGTGAIGLEA